MIVCEPAPTAGGFGIAVPRSSGCRDAVPLQMSCQFSDGGVGERVPGKIEVRGLHRVERERQHVEARAERKRARGEARPAERSRLPSPVRAGTGRRRRETGEERADHELQRTADVAGAHVAVWAWTMSVSPVTISVSCASSRDVPERVGTRVRLSDLRRAVAALRERDAVLSRIARRRKAGTRSVPNTSTSALIPRRTRLRRITPSPWSYERCGWSARPVARVYRPSRTATRPCLQAGNAR